MTGGKDSGDAFPGRCWLRRPCAEQVYVRKLWEPLIMNTANTFWTLSVHQSPEQSAKHAIRLLSCKPPQHSCEAGSSPSCTKRRPRLGLKRLFIQSHVTGRVPSKDPSHCSRLTGARALHRYTVLLACKPETRSACQAGAFGLLGNHGNSLMIS